MLPKNFRLMALTIGIALLGATVYAQEQQAPKRNRPAAGRQREDTQARADSLRKLAEHLGVGNGAAIADIGAGKGRDTWVFADIVGEQGHVYSEEIMEDAVDNIREEADSRALPQVVPVLGNSKSPKLPKKKIDMAFMHYVYHHLAQPGKMLESIWQSLKPGGYYVVVDRHKGTLVDWVPREEREKSHHWLAETTVIREAREAGFSFYGFGEDDWYNKDDVFVLILRRPVDHARRGHDPDPMLPIKKSIMADLRPDSGKNFGQIALVALGEGREPIKPLVKKCQGEAVDIVLEEWATQKDERPEVPRGVTLRSVLTEQGDPQLGTEKFDAVYFLDTYHLLFHGDVLLPALREHLKQDGRVYVLDRTSEKVLPHREASHRRMIAPATVKNEMAEYGFQLQSSKDPVSPGRFLLVFGIPAKN